MKTVLLDLFTHYRHAGTLRQRRVRMARFVTACQRHRLSAGHLAGLIMVARANGQPLPDQAFLPLR